MKIKLTNMKIDQLPVEIVMKIFNFLPMYNELKLINKQFYGVWCELKDSKTYLRIDNQMDSQCLHSIQTSKRRVTKLEIGVRHFSNEHRQLYLSIIKNFSSSIKSLTCRDAHMDEPTFLEILSLTPNIQHLDLHLISFKVQPSKRRRCNDDLKLKKLKSLSIVGCDNRFFRILNRLPAGVLLELKITHFHWQTFTAALIRQPNIKKLKFGCFRSDSDEFPTDTFHKLKLESLELDGHKMNGRGTIAVSILAKQTKLKSLTVSNAMSFNRIYQIMSSVAGLTELEVLEIDVVDTQDGSFENIFKLRNLKDLTLRFGVDDFGDTLVKLTKSDNMSVVKLTLAGQLQIPVNVISALAKSAPNIRSLRVLLDDNRVDNLCATESEILVRFNFVKLLELNVYNAPLLNHRQYFNENLSEAKFSIFGSFYKEWLVTLIASYPNLKKLELILARNDISISSNDFPIQPILNGFPKLESLKLCAFALRVNNLDELQNHKGNLKYVSLGRLYKDSLNDELIRKLRTKFGVLKIVDSKYVNMAVDRYTYTMFCESDSHRY